MKRTRLALTLGIAVMLVASTSRAEEPAVAAAREHFRRGSIAYNLGHYLDAAAEYEKAYEIRESPALLYNLGQAYRGAGEHQKALTAYRAYLRNAPDGANRDEAAHFIEALKHTIEVEKATQEKPPMGPMPEPSKQPPQVAPPPAVVVTPPPPPPRLPDQHELALGRKLRYAGIAVGAAGVASAVVGGVFAGQTASINSQLNNPAKTNPPPVYNKALESKGRTDQSVETALFAVGGAAVVTGVTLLVVGTQKVKRNTFALVPMAAPGRVGAAFTLDF